MCHSLVREGRNFRPVACLPKTLLCAAVLLTAGVTSAPAECVNLSEFAHQAGWWEEKDHEPLAVVVRGTYAYVTARARAGGSSADFLFTYDLSDPATPERVDAAALPDPGIDLAVVGSRVYALCYRYMDGGGWTRIVEFDATDPARPVEIGEYSPFAPGDQGRAIASSPSRLYVVGRTNGSATFLQALDPSVPGVLPTIGYGEVTTPFTSVADLAVREPFVYTAIGTARLQIWDIGTLPSLVPPNEIQLPFTVETFALTGNHLLAGGGELAVLDVSVPAIPLLRGTVPSLGPIRRLAASGDTVVVASNLDIWDTKLELVSIAEPSAPAQLMRWSAPGAIHDLGWGLTGAVACTGQWSVEIPSGVRVLDFRVAEGAPLELVLTPPGQALDLDLAGTFLAVALGSPGVRIYDATTPLTPTFRAQRLLSGPALAVDLVDSILLVAQGDAGFAVMDAGVSSLPLRASIGGFSAVDIVGQGNLAVVAGGDDIRLYDLTNPTQPVLRSTIPFSATHLALEGSRLLARGGLTQAREYAIADPDHPQLLRNWSAGPDVRQMVWGADGVYYSVASGMQWFALHDPLNPSNWPTPLEWPPAPARAAARDGDLLVIGLKDLGYAAYAVTDPRAPRWIGGSSVSLDVRAVAIGPGAIYLAAGQAGVFIGPRPCTPSTSGVEGTVAGGVPASVQVVPNPAVGAFRISYDLPRSGWVEVRLYDCGGRERARFDLGPQRRGRQSVQLDLNDLLGAHVPRGNYFVVVRSEGGEARGQFAIVER